MKPLPFSLERGILMCATRETAFSFFTDSSLFARWWGEGSHIDAKPSGVYLICYSNGATASGQVLEMDAPHRVVLSYGYDDPNKGIPSGGSRVTITLEERANGTWLLLRHDVDTQQNRDAHVGGWKYQLAILSNVASQAQVPDANALLDRCYSAWAEKDPSVRARALGEVAAPEVIFRDPYGVAAGVDELSAHLGAIQVFMPGIVPRRHGDVRVCHGCALVPWRALAPDGTVKSQGTHAVEFSPHGKLSRVTGFWDP